MNNLQRAKLDTCNRVKDCLTKFESELKSINELAAEKAAFMTALETINNSAQAQVQTAGAVTDAVQAAKEYMVAMVVKFARRGKVVASQNKNMTLVNHLDHGVTYFLRATKTMAVQRATAIRDHLNDNLTTLTNISVADIGDLSNAIAAYDAIKEQPINNIQARSAAGTNPLPAAFSLAFMAIDNMNDLVKSYFEGVNQPLVDEFDLATQILNTGVHRTGIEGMVTKNGIAIAHATIKIVGTDKTGQSDLDGYYIISRIKSGDYLVEVISEEGEKASKTAHVSKGSYETVDFIL